jgi:hypothetical protein
VISATTTPTGCHDNAMRVTVTDTAGTSGTVTADRSEVAAAIRPWFTPDASPEVHAAIDRLQQSLDRAPADQLGTEDTDLSTTRLCAFLGIKLRLADADRQEEEAAIMGEPTPKSTDEIPSGNKPIEGVGTSTPGFSGDSPEIPVLVVIVLVVVSAIGSGFGMLLARKARAARQRGAESSA